MHEHEVRWERMFPDQLEQAFVECPVVYFPYGMCEPHGPQCTLGLDALKVHAIARLTARARGGIVAPLDYWHIHELGGYAVWAHDHVGQVDRTWLTSVPPWQHFRNVLYHIRTADSHRFEAAIFLTGHYGPNWEDLRRLLELVQPYVGTRLYGLPDFEANTPGFDGDGRSGGDHAGKVETSLLWALEPDCVDPSRMPHQGSDGMHFAMGPNARDADRRVGERMVADEIAYLGAVADRLRSDYRGQAREHRLRTFADVEAVWLEVVAPQFGMFRTMAQSWMSSSSVPADSCWYENWAVPDRAPV